MRSFYNYMLRSKPLVPLAFCYAVVVLIGLIQKFFLFRLGLGDNFYYVFQLIKNTLNTSDASFTKFLSYIMFLGSFYGVFLWGLILIILVFLYAALVQFLIHIFVKSPARFGTLLAVFFSTFGLLYVFVFIPFIGMPIFALGFLYIAGKGIGDINSLSTLKGVLFLIAPKLLFMLVLLLTVSSLLSMVSFF